MIERIFGDGKYKFHIGYDEAVEWERKRRKGLYPTMVALLAGDWQVADVTEVVRVAMIGGGSDPVEAFEISDRYVRQRPLIESMQLAIDVLELAYFGTSEGDAT
ncbi:gene transfer agent family protein [Rhizobium sp. Rhizsp82]|uniref:gene transfer agent family protein n=1 Tax=Rhizobium sp. Rhizsp82 TaxID=3243057 RepID=UPI0039B49185